MTVLVNSLFEKKLVGYFFDHSVCIRHGARNFLSDRKTDSQLRLYAHSIILCIQYSDMFLTATVKSSLGMHDNLVVNNNYVALLLY